MTVTTTRGTQYGNSVISKDPDYVDLDLDFFANPTTKDVVKKSGNEAIKRSVRNLIFTNYYEKPFRPDVGSGVRELLFENATPLTIIYLQDAIKLLLVNYEPRIQLISVIVTDDLDNNGFNVSLEYIILNRQQRVVSTLFLERIR